MNDLLKSMQRLCQLPFAGDKGLQSILQPISALR